MMKNNKLTEEELLYELGSWHENTDIDMLEQRIYDEYQIRVYNQIREIIKEHFNTIMRIPKKRKKLKITMGDCNEKR